MTGTALFPDPPRSFRGRRWAKIGLRAVHVLCAAIATGAYVLAGGDPAWLWAAVGTGVLLLLLDLHESAAFLLEVRGLIVLGKVTVIAFWPLYAGAAGWVLPALVVVSVVSSHAPASFRHRLVFRRGEVAPSTSRG